MDSAADLPSLGGVAPFGDPRIKACSRLPKAFRSVPRPSSPLGAKASTRCPCFPRPPPATTTASPRQACGLSEHRMRQPPPGTIPASTTNYKCWPMAGRSQPAASIPMPKHGPATDGRRGQNRATCRRPPYQGCMKESLPPCPATTGTSSPPHDVQGTRPATARPQRAAVRANGALFRAAGSRPGPRGRTAPCGTAEPGGPGPT